MSESTSEALERLANDSSMMYSDPWEVLYRANPEIASWAYANRAGILTPENMPAFIRFRELQHDQKLAILNKLVKEYEIDSHERQVGMQINGQIKTQQLSEDGQTERSRIGLEAQLQGAKIVQDGETMRNAYSQDKETERQELMVKNALAVLKLQYETNRETLNNQTQMQKYVSDGQLEGIKIQANAQRDTIELVETIRADKERTISQQQLTAMVKQNEMQYLAEIKKAEAMRSMHEQDGRQEIIFQYLRAQLELRRVVLGYEAQKHEQSIALSTAFHSSLDNIVKHSLNYLSFSGKSSVHIRATTPHGNFEYKVGDE